LSGVLGDRLIVTGQIVTEPVEGVRRDLDSQTPSGDDLSAPLDELMGGTAGGRNKV
jgi:hypothetical protein